MAQVRARVSPLSRIQKIKEARLRAKGTKIAPGIHPSNTTAIWYRDQLDKHIDAMHAAIEAELYPLLRADSQVLQVVDAKWFQNRDSLFGTLLAQFKKLTAQWEIANTTALGLASAFVGKVDATTKKAIEKVVGDAMGVDLVKIIDTEGLRDITEAGIAANVSLIKSIPKDYLDKIEMIITQEGTKGRTGESLIKQIQEVYPVTKRRAEFIARDQTAKLNGDITRQRQVAAGIRGYRWRTVGDGAVRESHKERNGKFYAWNPEDVGQKLEDGSVMLDPEADDIGHPGEDYRCRCIAEAVIEFDRI
jgi:phage putative head morphogenesis protein, SPP1 gp7 family